MLRPYREDGRMTDNRPAKHFTLAKGSPMQDLFSVKGKVAVVTGGGQGIGRMITQGLVESGAKTYISSRKSDVIEEVASELSKSGECIPIQADLSTEAGCRALGEEIARREDELHLLVNNAGNNWGAPFEEFPDAGFDRVFALNVKGVFHTTRALMPLLEKAATDDDPARVVNIGSVDGIKAPFLETYSYSTSKAAVHHLTRVLARKFAPKRITVNAIAPGPFESKMMHETLERFGDTIKNQVPLGRIGRPEDMAGAVIFLASRAGSYLTGAVIPIDGGSTTDHV
jgi:NAD(P)-dependent dehydrogenase (short-subunit alcohol dehydrogenase family)